MLKIPQQNFSYFYAFPSERQSKLEAFHGEPRVGGSLLPLVRTLRVWGAPLPKVDVMGLPGSRPMDLRTRTSARHGTISTNQGSEIWGH